MKTIQVTFSLADITDLEPFRRLGARLAADPDGHLRRTAISAKIVTGADGQRRTDILTTTGADVVYSQATLMRVEDAIEALCQQILACSFVPARKTERNAAEPILQVLREGMGEKAEQILSAYLDRAGRELVQLVTTEYRKFGAKPQIEEIIEIKTFAPVRTARTTTSQNRHGPFNKSIGYEGWKKSMYSQAWFDSEPERAVANLLDDAPNIAFWVRLHIGDLPILWSGAGNTYNPDFVAVEEGGTHWIVEIKSDKERDSQDVQAKEEAAKRWANHVSADPDVDTRWRYLLVTEAEIDAAKGSWPALKQRER